MKIIISLSEFLIIIWHSCIAYIASCNIMYLSSVNSSHDIIELIDKNSINKSVYRVFRNNNLCDFKYTKLYFYCKLNKDGAIEYIKLVDSSQNFISGTKIRELEIALKEALLFYIPSDLKSDKMSKFRYSTVVIPFKTYCKN